LTKPVFILLWASLLLIGCASTPWVCTPQTCVSVAKADLPESIRGSWTAADGSSLKIVNYLVGDIDDLENTTIAPKAASAMISHQNSPTNQLHITSFDGSIVIGEEYLGGMLIRSDRSPRRFYRIKLQQDQLTVEQLNLEALDQTYEANDLKLVEFEGMTAVVYTNVRDVAAVMVQLLTRDDVWDNTQIYARNNT